MRRSSITRAALVAAAAAGLSQSSAVRADVFTNVPASETNGFQIVYDLNDGTVRLTNEAWLTDGQTEISGPLLVYNIREQRVQAAASPGTDQRVHITIAPRVKPPPPDAGKGDPAKPHSTAQP